MKRIIIRIVIIQYNLFNSLRVRSFHFNCVVAHDSQIDHKTVRQVKRSGKFSANGMIETRESSYGI